LTVFTVYETCVWSEAKGGCMVWEYMTVLKRLCLLLLLFIASLGLFAQVFSDGTVISRDLLSIFFIDDVSVSQIEDLCYDYSWCSLTRKRYLGHIVSDLFFGNNVWLFSYNQDIIEETSPLYTEEWPQPNMYHPFLVNLRNRDIVRQVYPEPHRMWGLLVIDFEIGVDAGQINELCHNYSWCDLSVSPLQTTASTEMQFNEDAVASVLGDYYALILQLWDENIIRRVNQVIIVPVIKDIDETIDKPHLYSFVYPNPSKGENLTIKTNISTPQKEVKIYNVKGQRVAKSGHFQSKNGESSFIIDLQNEVGYKLPSGVYFYQIKADKETLSGKFLLLK